MGRALVPSGMKNKYLLHDVSDFASQGGHPQSFVSKFEFNLGQVGKQNPFHLGRTHVKEWFENAIIGLRRSSPAMGHICGRAP